MFHVTERAAERLRTVIAELDIHGGICLRLGETQEGPKMVRAQPRPGDTTVKVGDDVLLVVDAATAGRLDGSELDLDESTERLVFT